MSAKRKSSKRSATSRTSPPEDPPLFIDRDAWSSVLGEALDSAGVAYVPHGREFPPDGTDADWIGRVGEKGWIAVTRDRNIRRKPNELAAIRRSQAIVFVFTSGNLSAADTAAILLRALPRIRRLARATRRPALYSIRQDGSIGPLTM